MSSFTFHTYHREATCSKCSKTLSDLRISGSAPGMGQYRGHCGTCKTSTWYDCAEGSIEMMELNEFREKSQAK